MTDTVIIALISLTGTIIGAFGGVMTANKLSNYRINQLEKKVDKHNTVIERMYIAESAIKVLDTRQKITEHILEELEVENGRKQ